MAQVHVDHVVFGHKGLTNVLLSTVHTVSNFEGENTVKGDDHFIDLVDEPGQVVHREMRGFGGVTYHGIETVPIAGQNTLEGVVDPFDHDPFITKPLLCSLRFIARTFYMALT